MLNERRKALCAIGVECCPCLKQGLPSKTEMQSIFPKGRQMDVMVCVNMIKKPSVRMHTDQKIRSFGLKWKCHIFLSSTVLPWVHCYPVEVQYWEELEWPAGFTCCLAVFVISPFCYWMTLSFVQFQESTSLCSWKRCLSHLGKALFAILDCISFPLTALQFCSTLKLQTFSWPSKLWSAHGNS